MIIIHLSKLEKESIITLEGVEEKEILEIEDSNNLQIDSPLQYKLNATIVGRDVLVKGKVSVDISGICGRCLTKTTQKVCNDNICLYFETENIGEELDITEEIRAELLLSLPMLLICNENCKGLCQTCGANLNLEDCNCSENNQSKTSGVWSELDKLNL